MILLRIFFVMFCLLKSSITKSEDVKTELVNVGKSRELSCKFDNINFTRLTWSYKPYGTVTEIVIYSMNDNLYWRNYEAYCQPKAQFCNITLLYAREESAGRYWCKIATRRGQARFIACTIEVAVGEMKCHSNIHHPVIGENDCPRSKAYDDILERYCSLDYYGNPNLTLRLNWIGRHKSNKTINEDSIRRHKIKLGEKYLKSLIHQDEILAKNFINGITYECHLENNLSFDSCSLPTLEVEYVRYPLQRSVNLTTNNINDTICYVEKSDNVNCSYFWKFESFGVNTRIINNSILTTNDIQSSGFYTCTAICQLGTSKECNITAMELFVISKKTLKNSETSESSESYKKAVVIVTTIVVSLIAIAIFLILVICGRRRKRKSSKRQETNQMPLLEKNDSFSRDEKKIEGKVVEIESEEKKEETTADNIHEDIKQGEKKEGKVEEKKLEEIKEEETWLFKKFNEKEEFIFSEPFRDKDIYRYLPGQLRGVFREYKRLGDIVLDRSFSILVNTQNLLKIKNLMADVTACIQYEHKFKKKIIQNLIYPQNENGESIYNPSGKYMVKLYFDGNYRKVIIDDFLPVDIFGQILSLFSESAVSTTLDSYRNITYSDHYRGPRKEYWLSLLEKAYMKVHYYFKYSLNISKAIICQITILTGWIPSGLFLSNSKFQTEKILNEFMKGNCLISLRNEKDEHFFIIDIKKNTGIQIYDNNYQENEFSVKLKMWDIEKFIERPFKNISLAKLNEYEVMYIYWNPSIFDYSETVHGNVEYKKVSRYKLVVDLDNDDSTTFIHLNKHFLDEQLSYITERARLRLIVLRNTDMNHHHSASFMPMTQAFNVNEYNDFFEMKVCPLCRELNILVEGTLCYFSKKKKFTLNVYSASKFNLTKLDDFVFPYEQRAIVDLENIYDFHVKSENGSNYIFFELMGTYHFSEFKMCTLKFRNMEGECLKEHTVERKRTCYLDLQNVQEGSYKIEISGKYEAISLSKKLDCYLNISSTCSTTIVCSIIV